MAVNKQENKATKQLETRKIHANEVHAKLVNLIEDKICATKNNLKCIIKEMLKVCENCTTAKRKQKLLHKVAEELTLKPGDIIYLDLISQKKRKYGGSTNWILIQESDKKANMVFLHKGKRIFD